MRTSTLVFVWLLTAALVTDRGSAETETQQITCQKSRNFLAPADSSDYRKYAPDRKVDILHLALDVTPDFKQRTVAGTATLRFKPIASALDELRLDGIDLQVSSITATEKTQGYQVTDKEVVISFEKPIPAGQEVSVTVVYRAQPSKGLYFRTAEMGYKPEDEHCFTQGEAIEARHWYPSYDSPNEKFTSEVTCHVPEGMVVLSNGRLVSEEKDAGSSLVAVRWAQEKPHANYLISMLAGHFKKVEDKYKDVPLAFYVPASEINEAASSFRDTIDIMGFFEQEIGVPYPWAKYYQVCVTDFGWGGMENTSITTLNDNTLFTTATENLRDSQGLVAHEMAHQWFGDLVTCKDWSHIWLNEGFATYYAHLYDGYKNGRDAMLYGLYGSARGITSQANDTVAIVHRNYNHPDEVFGFLAYPKGSWILHMLRNQLGEGLYRRCIKTYLERHQFGNVVTSDLSEVIEELSGRSWDQFFDQYVYHAHHPELAVSYNWDEKTRLAKISIAQNQQINEAVLLFNVPLTIRFKSKSGSVDRVIRVKEKSEDFYFPLPEAPLIVRVDPDLALLAKIGFSPPGPMLLAQLADETDALGRILAIEQLATRKDHETIEKLKHVLNHDAFYGARLDAARALRSIHTDESLQALLASTQQSDARVRRQVVADINGFYGATSYEAAQKVIKEEKNPDILVSAIGAAAAYSQPETRDTLLAFLNTPSYRNTIADAAMGAFRTQDNPANIEPLREYLQKNEQQLPTSSLSRGLNVLAFLARREENKDAVREFVLRFVNHLKKSIQLSAINSLGTLGDTRAIPVLEKFATAAKDSQERTAAERAIADIRAARKPADDLSSLRNEVLGLQKENRDLRKEMDDLKKRFQALEPNPDSTKPAKSMKASPKTMRK
ncbi:MAG TPA: M1 family aminopeptidase [Candidatus Eisenbacteria bacterium]|nr:M1 family aminopeptidase [Candidatus Eisenbacteria bacterium]